MSNDDFVEIVVNASMGTDYFIDRMCDELHKVAVNYTDCEHLGSPDSNLGHTNGMVYWVDKLAQTVKKQCVVTSDHLKWNVY
jgi:hypothetical protein